MKYSEYLQFRELLENNGITIEDFKKNPMLYEGILGTIGKKLWDLAVKGMKKAVSAGISNSKKEQLNKKAAEIKQWVVDDFQKAEDDEKHPMNKFLKAKSNKFISRQIVNYINNQVQRQIKKVEQSISKNTNLDDTDKDNLLDYWEDLSIQIKLSVASSLNDNGIIDDSDEANIVKAIRDTLTGNADKRNDPVRDASTGS